MRLLFRRHRQLVKACEKLLDAGGNFLAVRLKGEMPRIEKMRLDVGKIPIVWSRTLGRKDVIVFPPDNQRRRLILTEEFLKLRVERNVASVVIKHVELNVAVPRTVQQGLIQCPGRGVEMTQVAHSPF